MPRINCPAMRLSQGVQNRNNKVIRRYQANCKVFEKEYQTAMRGYKTTLADDLLFAYYLLKQMEKYEDEKLIKKDVVLKCAFNISPTKIQLSRSNSKPSPAVPQTDRPGRRGEMSNEKVPSVRPLTAPAAGRSQILAQKKNIFRRYGHNKPQIVVDKKKSSKETRSKSAPVTSLQLDAASDDDEPLPPTPLARFTRTYEYNRKVMLCRSRQEQRRLARIRECNKEGDKDSDNQSFHDDASDYILLEESEVEETRKHDYWIWKIDVLFEKWRRNDRQLEDDDIYSLYEEDLNEEVFDKHQVQSYIKPGIRQVKTMGRTKLAQFTRDKVVRYRWAFTGDGFKDGGDTYKASGEIRRKSRQKNVTAELGHNEKQKIRAEADAKCLKLKRLVQESDFLRNEVYQMAPFYRTKQSIIAKLEVNQPGLFQ